MGAGGEKHSGDTPRCSYHYGGLVYYGDDNWRNDDIYRHLKWKAFGNRIKVAYSAKFCGENTAFTEEVDQLILAMESLGNGATKKTQLGRLKRLAKFVEVPFAVPEEDRLSEEEKTLLFDKEFGADYGRKKKIQA